MAVSHMLDADARAQEHLAKALNFQRMGMMASAEHELSLVRQLNPAIVTEPSYKSFYAQQAEQQSQAQAWRLPLRVGSALLFTDMLVFGFLGLVSIVSGTFGEFLWGIVARIVVDLYLSINLIRLKEGARRATLWWAVVNLIVSAFAAIPSINWLALITQIGFSGSLLILLLRMPSKVRAGLAIAVFLIGDLGTLCGFFVLSVMDAIR